MALRTDREWHKRSDNVGYGWCHKSSENTAASQDEDPATLTHQGKLNCTVTATTHLQQHKQRQEEDQSQLQDEHGEIAETQNLQTKIDLSDNHKSRIRRVKRKEKQVTKQR